ncbi:MAG: thiol protease/hemagglutinin PrtT [Bacteroidales bacterium]|nr:thiol protease/hemagglutinin PrtT [Bacteroidales bacterium]
MRKTLFLMMTLALFVGQLIAAPVGEEQARQLGLKYVQSHAGRQVANLTLAYTQMTESGNPAVYVFNYENGSVFVSADDVARPILGCTDEPFDMAVVPDGLAYYLRYYARQIEFARENNLEPEMEVTSEWRHVAADGFENDNRSTRGDIAPLISTNWNQDYPYNAYCPTGHGGPQGHAYAGCVATAMSMVMKKWNWPDHGQGSHSYTPDTYPEQSVDFENTYYQWSSMPNSCNNSNYQAVATLMYHCGVSVDMMYGGSASGAYSQDVPAAIHDYFRYTEHATRLERDLYSKAEWEQMLIRNLEYDFPLYYSGSDTDGGHAFVCCGYRQSDNKFYFNWGWSGAMNNYYAIDALNTYSGHFNQGQAAIFDFIPGYIYDALLPAVDDLSVTAENAHSKTGVIRWTNPTVSLSGQAIENIEQVVLLRNGVQIFTQSNVVPGEEMSFEDNVADFDCYTYRLYYLSNGVKGRFADANYQYGPTCTWKVIGQTTNFQGWNGGKIQVLNSFNSVVEEVTMTSATPVSQLVRMPEGAVALKWVAPSTAVTSITINVKNSNNQSVYSYTGNSNQVPATLFEGDNDCGGCEPPTGLNGEYQWTGDGFGTLLTWIYDADPQSFKVYRSIDGIDYEEVATVDKTAREYFDAAEEGTYYYKVTAFRSYCESTPAWTDGGDDYIRIEVTSVGENDVNSSLFPNPANTMLCVEAEGLQQVTIFNMMGQVVYRQACDQDGVVVNTSHFAQGVYTITIKSSNGQTTQRFTVVH